MVNSYAFSRGNSASVRLYIQHWMWSYQLGYLLHPEIDIKGGKNIKVADVACGTAAWLVETARMLPDAQFDGYDISSDEFPDRKRLPENVSLFTLDALGSVPEQLVGKYDVVHISLFVMLVRNEDPGPVLENLMRMLKPGGYLQWEESDLDSLHASMPEQDLSESCNDGMVAEYSKWFSAQGITAKWVKQMDSLFAQHALTVIYFRPMPIGNDMAKPWTCMQIMAAEDIMENAIIPAAEKDSEASPTAGESREMFEGLAKRCQDGMSITMDMAVAVGRKGGS